MLKSSSKVTDRCFFSNKSNTFSDFKSFLLMTLLDDADIFPLSNDYFGSGGTDGFTTTTNKKKTLFVTHKKIIKSRAIIMKSINHPRFNIQISLHSCFSSPFFPFSLIFNKKSDVQTESTILLKSLLYIHIKKLRLLSTKL